MEEWYRRLLADPQLQAMGHYQRVEDANLGFGWLYYAIARVQRPKAVLVVGSWRGFVPLVLAHALAHNTEGGEVILVEPSLVDDFWLEPDRVAAQWAHHGVTNIRHFAQTTQQFAASAECASLRDVGMLFVDGYHTEAQARFDHEALARCLTSDAVIVFHDSVRERRSAIYGEDRPYSHSVHRYMEQLRGSAEWDVWSMPQADGVTLVKRRAA